MITQVGQVSHLFFFRNKEHEFKISNNEKSIKNIISFNMLKLTVFMSFCLKLANSHAISQIILTIFVLISYNKNVFSYRKIYVNDHCFVF